VVPADARVAPTANAVPPLPSGCEAIMTWALWLAVPVGATTLAALWSWVRGWRVRRAERPLDTEAAVRAHSEYLDALVIPAHSAARPPSRVLSEAAEDDGAS
jgi:hypothetical protein